MRGFYAVLRAHVRLTVGQARDMLRKRIPKTISFVLCSDTTNRPSNPDEYWTTHQCDREDRPVAMLDSPPGRSTQVTVCPAPLPGVADRPIVPPGRQNVSLHGQIDQFLEGAGRPNRTSQLIPHNKNFLYHFYLSYIFNCITKLENPRSYTHSRK